MRARFRLKPNFDFNNLFELKVLIAFETNIFEICFDDVID
jgi:hypothetical protein